MTEVNSSPKKETEKPVEEKPTVVEKTEAEMAKTSKKEEESDAKPAKAAEKADAQEEDDGEKRVGVLVATVRGTGSGTVCLRFFVVGRGRRGRA